MKNCVKFLLLLLLILPLSNRAQSSGEVGFLVGGTDYLGDVSRDFPQWADVGLSFGATGRYMFDPKFGVKLFFGYLQLKGSDRNVLPRRGWETQFGLFEVTASFEYHPFGKARKTIFNEFRKGQFSPYVFAGGGIASADADIKIPPGSNWVFPEEADRDVFVSVPIGGGLRYDLSPYCILSFDVGMRAVFSDYLDGISIQGKSDTNDWYSFTGLSVTALLGAERSKNWD
ncbi:MAG TPA: DUF6089 family protein [Saprospiraceae bacterium]|nr:DUF6089 family protein [Saprospiraceae bacterium]HMQ84969.1 DUF6089 family protein [Saprospiraceae bacterium]